METVDLMWLAATRAQVQRMAGQIASCETGDIGRLIEPLVAAIEPPPDLLHLAALTTELLDGCREIVDRLHDGAPSPACTCHALCWSYVGRFAAWREHDPRLVFRDWLRRLIDHFGREHPPTAIVRIAAQVRADPTQSWTLDRLAAAAGLSPTRLRDEFERQFGVKPSAYVQLVRATRAVALFGTAQKVESVAWDVGYRSKKDLYAALDRWVGATPTELRALPDIERDWLDRQLRMRCLRRVRLTTDASSEPGSSDTQACRPPLARRRSAQRRHR
jgi:AraC-like DNA-binding protein